ncbi:two-component regulator propeller domain-containing protein [Mitsuaria sp. GD03876]|uniref:ligand-binding sensor domain-containing diguanylate cyclase n=1 Tax=Mitsuaria sp. GD03876 TaxID=2975399 RepID=UPI00244ACD0E|nr:two-component regulator propeller domain-containing protein [Mitsuaria sp. GD03876]MDH0864478.1 diguanylate cyclase [Mitsuaria sp. GD03876]
MTSDRSPLPFADFASPPLSRRGVVAWVLAGMAMLAAGSAPAAPVAQTAQGTAAASGASAASARKPAPSAASASAASAASPGAVAGGGDLADPVRAVSQYKIDLWQTEQGLPLNTVQALLQSRDGGLWIGTAGGLARFDGKRFVTFEASQSLEAASQPIFALLEDRQGRLWIGHPTGAVVYEHGRFRPAITKAQAGGRRIWSFAEGRDGAIWAAGDGGLVRWKEGQVKTFGPADGLPTARLRTVAFDTAGTLWIATTGAGLFAMTPDGKFKVFDASTGFPHPQVRFLLPDPEGGIWAATAGGGLVRLRGIDRPDQRIYTTADGLPSDHLTALTRDTHGDLWVGSWGAGVSRLRDGRFSTVSTGSGAGGGLAGSQIWTLMADREGSVWVGTWVDGLNRLRNRAFTVLGTPEGLSHDNVRSVVAARDGAIWAATSGGGLNRLQDGRITTLRQADGLPTDEISTLHEARDGSLWIGTYTAGLARRLPDGRLETFGAGSGLPGVEVRSIYEDRSGTLWVGTRTALARFNGTGFDVVTAPGLPNEGVAAILQDRAGALWFGTTGQGLVRWRDGQARHYTTADGLLSDWIIALKEDARGELWIGTNGEGINRLKGGRVGAIKPADGLWDGLSQVFLEDRAGQFWITCNRGFYRVARDDLDAFLDGRAKQVRSVGFGPGDTLRATSFAGNLQAAGAVDARGRVWLPSSAGLVVVDPERLPGGGAPPAVRIEQIRVDGEPLPADGQALDLPPGPVALSISLAASTLREADRVRFRFWMDGLSRGWTDVGNDRELTFPALSHGQYRLRLAASADGQRWREAETPLPVTVRPRFHETGWFHLLVGLACIGLFAGGVMLRMRQLRRRQIEMERLVAQRTEELRQANEHLKQLSFLDALTGLPNRRRFNEAADEEWRRARRAGTALGLVLVDVDAFKRYNDQMGHLKGDECLAAVGAVLGASIGRAGDLAARYGGEEFIVLLPGADRAAALQIAEHIRAGIESLAMPHPASPAGPVVTVSLGVAACVPDEERTLESLIAEADDALYAAKREGRNRVR